MATLYENSTWVWDGQIRNVYGNTWWYAQTFTPQITHNISSVILSLAKQGSPGTITVSIRETTDGKPSGEDLCSGTTNGNTLPEGDWPTPAPEEREITFDTNSMLDADSKYAIVVRALSGSSSNKVWWAASTSSVYANGDQCTSNGGTTWTLYDSRELWFEEYGSPPSGPSKPINPIPENNDTEVDFSGFTLSWEDGGDADTYDVYIGESGSLIEVSSTQAGISYITNLSELETIYDVSPIDQKIYWRVDATNAGGTTTGDEWNFDARPPKPSNPSPEHEETNIASSKTPLSYTSSDAAITHDVYFRVKGDTWTQLASEIEDILSWRMPFVYLNIKDYNPAEVTGYRSPIVGDILYDDSDSYTVTYVVRGTLYNLQYQAKLYAFRTTGSGVKNRGDVVTNGVAPDVNNPQAVAVTLDDRWFFRDDVEKIHLPQNATYEWRIDATGIFGTVTGDTWEFSTFTFAPPFPTGITLNIEGADGDDPAGVPEGDASGENFMTALRSLVAAANDRIWYEDI